MGALGDFALKLSTLIAVLGILLVITAVARDFVLHGSLTPMWTPEMLAALVLYLILAPVVFFTPLWVAHDAMKKAKCDLLLGIADRFKNEHTNVHHGLQLPAGTNAQSEIVKAQSDADILTSPNPDIEGLGGSLKTLKDLQALYELTSAFPVWPFSLPNLRRFATTYVSPFLLAILIELLVWFVTRD